MEKVDHSLKKHVFFPETMKISIKICVWFYNFNEHGQSSTFGKMLGNYKSTSPKKCDIVHGGKAWRIENRKSWTTNWAMKKTWLFRVYGCQPKNRGKPPKSSILIGFSIIFTIHFGVITAIFGNTHCFPGKFISWEHIYTYLIPALLSRWFYKNFPVWWDNMDSFPNLNENHINIISYLYIPDAQCIYKYLPTFGPPKTTQM